MNWEQTIPKTCLILTAGRRTPTTRLSVSRFISSSSSRVLCVFCSALKLQAFILPAKAQKVEMDKLEKAKKERTKVRLAAKERGLLRQRCSVSASGAGPHQLSFTSAWRSSSGGRQHVQISGGGSCLRLWLNLCCLCFFSWSLRCYWCVRDEPVKCKIAVQSMFLCLEGCDTRCHHFQQYYHHSNSWDKFKLFLNENVLW